MASGGRREGTPGKAYANRSDLNANRTLPASAATGQAYGAAKAQIESQRAVPMAAPPVAPGSLPPLDSPTNRPSEPLTAGAALGPGPGTEVLPELPAEGIDPDLARAAKHLPMLELMASLPTATVASRNFVRRLRGIVPTEPI